MGEAISLIVEGCRVAKELESNLPKLANQTTPLSKSLEEVIDIFITANQKLNNVVHPAGGLMPLFRCNQHVSNPGLQQQHVGIEPTLFHELMQRTGCTSNGMDLFQSQLNMAIASAMTTTGSMLETRTSMAGIQFGSSGLASMDITLESARGATSTNCHRNRRDKAVMRTIKVAAPRIGNTEMPPDDGFTWRKYGQKEILGSRFPRSYFRCTHQKMYQCKAKKQVQRLDEDPLTFEVTYYGDHKCHMSATAPATVPPSAPQIAMVMTKPTSTAAMDASLGTDPLGQLLGFSLGSSSFGGGGAGPSTARDVRGQDDEYIVTDMAAAMFNSGSSNTTNMEFLFTTTTTTTQNLTRNPNNN